MARKKYKELYLKEQAKSQRLNNVIDYYKDCLEYLNEKGIVEYENYIRKSECSFSQNEYRRIKIGEDYETAMVTNIDYF